METESNELFQKLKNNKRAVETEIHEKDKKKDFISPTTAMRLAFLTYLLNPLDKVEDDVSTLTLRGKPTFQK